MEFGVEPTQDKPRSLWPLMLAGAVIVGGLLLAFGLLPPHVTPSAPGEKPLPFGPAEQGYAANVKFENPKMSRFENLFKQQVTYVAGDICNSGNRTVADVQITVEFHNIENQVVLRQTLRPMEPKPVAIPPGQRQSFQMGFDQVPDDWNMVYPTIRITGLALR